MSTNHPTLPNHQSELQIHLDNDTLIMHGSQQESSGCVLRGHVRLNLKEATKFKSITLRLVGKIKVAWSESTTSSSPQKFHKEERTIINKECSFLPTRRNQSHQLSAQQHRWDFEFALPGDLPDSIENNDTGSVQYRLKAIAERPTFLLNYTDKKSVRIVRHVLPSNTEWFSPMTITNEWANKLEYHISVPSKVFTEDEIIPVNLRIVPKLPGLKVRYLTCSLKEYVTYSAGSNNQFSKTEGRIVQFFRDEQFPCRGDVWQKTQRIKVPRCPSGVQFDTKNELIRIRHKLKFTMSLINADMHISELRAALPVIICPISQRTEENTLPAYEEALRAVPYFDPSEYNYSSGDSAAGSPVEEREALFENTEAADRAVQYLHQQWAASLNRVPSYRTALRDRPAVDRPTSLPSYDSLCVM